MNITIHNLRNEQPFYPWDIRIDRNSHFGNPFYMRDESQRIKVCDQFEEFLPTNKKMIGHLEALLLTYKNYGKLRLFCWCAPKRCHGESIIKKLEELLNQ